MLLMGNRRPDDEDVYAQHLADVARFACTLVSRDDAADVTVEAFLRVTASPAWERARNPRALWMRAVVYEARALHRSTRRRTERERRIAVAPGVVAAPEVGDPEVADALDQLPVQQRAALVLTYWLDLDPAAVAEVLGVSEGSVRKHLARARARLREVLA